MSSPILHGKNCDPVLFFAPPWAREQARGAAEPPRRLAEQPQTGQHKDNWPAFSGDRAALELQRQLSLDPIGVPQPPDSNSSEQSVTPLLLRACWLMAVAAVVAGAIVLIFGAKPRTDETSQVGPAAVQISNAPAKQNALRTAAMTPEGRPDREAGHDRQISANLSARPGAGTSGQSPPAISQRDASGALSTDVGAPTIDGQTPLVNLQEPSADGLVLRQLDRDEIASLVKRGEDFVSSGDIAAARLVLRRAAEAGDARAALSLAATFDPIVLEKLGVSELADAAMALDWYARAAQFGSAEAPRQLQQLANRVNLSPEQRR
jgi:hypothetical protein